MYGFSPNQIVFERNPNYLNNFDNQLPALEGKTSSQIAAKISMQCIQFAKNLSKMNHVQKLR